MSTIPAWTAEGVVAPIDLADPTSDVRSPYPVVLTDFVLRFATSPERIAIIVGLLNYRRQLHEIGLTTGFQWVDGSFLENVELLHSRAPGDVDVVTFYQLPAGETQTSLFARNPALFDHAAVKLHFRVDGYTVDLAMPPGDLVALSAYWYGVWSHQRQSYAWKGFVQLQLHPDADADAQAMLTTAQPEVRSP